MFLSFTRRNGSIETVDWDPAATNYSSVEHSPDRELHDSLLLPPVSI